MNAFAKVGLFQFCIAEIDAGSGDDGAGIPQADPSPPNDLRSCGWKLFDNARFRPHRRAIRPPPLRPIRSKELQGPEEDQGSKIFRRCACCWFQFAWRNKFGCVEICDWWERKPVVRGFIDQGYAQSG